MKNRPKNNLKSFLNVKSSSLTSADLYFYGDIVSDWWGAWQDADQYPEAIRDFLKEHENKTLNVYINSGGGSVFAGIAIYNMLKRHNGKVTVHVDGMAASIASVIALAGDEVIIPSNAFMFVHKPWVDATGSAEELRAEADALDVLESGIMNVYLENAAENTSEQTLKKLVAESTWITGSEAAELFSNVTVTDAAEYAAKITELTKSYDKLPKEIINSATAKSTAAELRNKLKKTIISGYTAEGE